MDAAGDRRSTRIAAGIVAALTGPVNVIWNPVSVETRSPIRLVGLTSLVVASLVMKTARAAFESG